MAQRYTFVNKPLQVLQKSEILARSDHGVKFLAKKFIRLGDPKDGFNSHLCFSILFNKQVKGHASMVVDVAIYALDGSLLPKESCVWRVPGSNDLFDNQTRNDFPIDTKELKIGILLRTDMEAMVSVRYYLDLGYTSNLQQCLNPFYIKLQHPKIHLITEDRKFLPKILERLTLPVIQETIFDDKDLEDEFSCTFDDLRMDTPLGNMGFMDHLENFSEDV